MADLAGFDANQVEDNRDFEVIPPGDYLVQWIDSEWKNTRDNTGRYLEAEMEILEGPHQGRKLWHRMNLDNKNPEAVRIANGELKSACVAVGNMTPRDSSELHFKPMIAKVKVGKPRDGYEASNEIGGYKPVPNQFAAAAQPQATVVNHPASAPGGGGGMATPAPAPAPAPQTQAASGQVPPWRR